MTDHEFAFREAIAGDLPAISRVRTSVRENHLSAEQLRDRGITNESVAASFLADSKGWVAVHGQDIVAFAIADRADRSIFALFVLPDYEGRGLGSRLIDLRAALAAGTRDNPRLADHRTRHQGCGLLRAPRMGCCRAE